MCQCTCVNEESSARPLHKFNRPPHRPEPQQTPRAPAEHRAVAVYQGAMTRPAGTEHGLPVLLERADLAGEVCVLPWCIRSPHPCATPSAVIAIVRKPPAAMNATRSRWRTSDGTRAMVTDPSPSSPWTLSPHVSTLPSTSSTVWQLPQATCTPSSRAAQRSASSR